MERILDLIRNSELLRVELVSLGLILLIFLINFFIKVGHKMFICGAILILVPAIWFGIIKMIIRLISQIRVPEEAWPWIWGSLAIILLLVILFIFRKRISIKKPKVARWWLVIPLLAIGIWGYKQYQISRLLNGEPNKITPTAIYEGPTVATATLTPSEKYFDLSGENQMKKGEWYLFRQGSGSLLQFAPKEVGTITYTIKMAEDETRTWKIKVTRCSNGNISEPEHLDIEPYDAAKRGVAYISIDKDANVVVVN